MNRKVWPKFLRENISFLSQEKEAEATGCRGQGVGWNPSFPLFPVWPWTCSLTSLCLRPLRCKIHHVIMGIMKGYTGTIPTKHQWILAIAITKGIATPTQTTSQGPLQLCILPFLTILGRHFYVINGPLMKKLLRVSPFCTIRMEEVGRLGRKDMTRPQEQEAGNQIHGPDPSGLPSSFLTSYNPSPSPGNKPIFPISNSCLGTWLRVFIQ